jgi:hypothetical protein
VFWALRTSLHGHLIVMYGWEVVLLDGSYRKSVITLRTSHELRLRRDVNSLSSIYIADVLRDYDETHVSSFHNSPFAIRPSIFQSTVNYSTLLTLKPQQTLYAREFLEQSTTTYHPQSQSRLPLPHPHTSLDQAASCLLPFYPSHPHHLL